MQYKKARVFIFDVIIPLIHIGLDVNLIWHYFHVDDVWWGGATIGAVLLPGALEFITYSYSFFNGDLQGTKSHQFKEYVVWTLFSLFYPLALVLYHAYHLLIKGDFRSYEVVARSRVLTGLSALTKSACQLMLQSSILMLTWGRQEDWNHGYQVASILVNAVMLAKSQADHFYFESSGKDIKVHASTWGMLSRLSFNFCHILVRGFTLCLLASYLQYLSPALLTTLLLANLATAWAIIDTEPIKHAWTAVAAVLTPTCFISRDTIMAKKSADKTYGKQLFDRFRLANAGVFFLVVSVVGLISTNMVLRFSSISKFDCENFPFLSFDEDLNCPVNSPFQDNPSILSLPPPHSWFYLVGNIVVPLLGLIHIAAVYMENRILKDSSTYV